MKEHIKIFMDVQQEKEVNKLDEEIQKLAIHLRQMEQRYVWIPSEKHKFNRNGEFDFSRMNMQALKIQLQKLMRWTKRI